tara:strand:+ start:1591 stop:2106 length:516 start_codon:yes stop_codon:yes gene_type:complete
VITKIDTGIPKRTNKRIIDELYSLKTWFFGLDINIKNIINKQDQGFSSITMSNEQTFVVNDILNIFGYLVFDIVEKNSSMKFKKINRIYWNWYHSNSVMQYHYDDVRDNYFSILYNLHDNDGGTEFKINDKVTFYKANESEALLFPSKLIHKGVAPKKSLNRFSLNIVLEI